MREGGGALLQAPPAPPGPAAFVCAATAFAPSLRSFPRAVCSVMSLRVGGQSLAVPPTADGAAPTQVFAVLCEKFKVDPKVGTYLVEACKCESLDDFTHLFVKEDEIGPFVEGIDGLEHKRLMVSRVRQAPRGAPRTRVSAARARCPCPRGVVGGHDGGVHREQ